MSTAGALDDYLDALLSEAPPAPAVQAAAQPIAAARVQVPADNAELEAAFEAAVAAREAAEATPAPTWDDLPDEVIYETSAAESAALTHTDSPDLQAAFEVAAGGGAAAAKPAPALPRLPPAVARPSLAPAARPSTWQELQAQAQRAQHAPPQRRASEKSSRWLRLRCGPQAYALELLKVQEVVLPVPLLALRGTDASMLGIMNLRGQVVPVLDLCRHLDVASTPEDSQTRIVVLEENGEILGLRVSAVEDVASLTDSQIEPPDTARICQISNELFRGIARLGNQPMILLDASRLLG
ncbi:chemotaxis protein CheW [Stenotrophomonas sp. SY1]|uniref:chemotaxis protein CheW n=1 Tax=Stenotrophomonas sp. SY1 TaxID=477235 RepID=UPI001E42C76F|nr:chemotaxis protein CheW [Stenotrophomonas sp. SY1]MCD9087180.1 chemotaxis protein CheW [Stenotrophomonas sp. SY1]